MPKQRRHRRLDKITSDSSQSTITNDAHSQERWPEAYQSGTANIHQFDMSHYPGADDRYEPVYAPIRFRPSVDSQIYKNPVISVRDGDMVLYGRPARGGGD